MVVLFPGEQRRRDYTWTIDPVSHRFGLTIKKAQECSIKQVDMHDTPQLTGHARAASPRGPAAAELSSFKQPEDVAGGCCCVGPCAVVY
jgi:hypothetical protein